MADDWRLAWAAALKREIARGRRFAADPELAKRLAELAAPGVGGDQVARTLVSGRDGLPEAERQSRLADLEAKASACTRCALHESRKQVVFGTGNPEAELMLVGEAPGRDEDAQGEPFVGRAGQLLNRILQAINQKREDVYIANVLKCRPPDNRNPSTQETALCSPFLFEQIELVAPKVVCALGRFACMTLLRSSSPLGRMRGRLHEVQGVPVVVTYHPAALLRYEHLKRPTWKDVQMVERLLAGETPEPWA